MNTYEQQKQLLRDYTDIIGMTFFQFINFCQWHNIPPTEHNFKEFIKDFEGESKPSVFDDEEMFKPDYYGEYASPERFDVNLSHAAQAGVAFSRKPLNEKQIAEAIERQKQRVLACKQIDIRLINESGAYMGVSIPNPSKEQKETILPFYIADY